MSNNIRLEWSTFPLLDFPKKSALLISFLVFFSIVLWRMAVIQWQMPLFYILGLFFLMIELSAYFTKVSYTFSENQIVAKYFGFKIEKSYDDFGCFYADKNGIMLSPFVRPRRLDRFRGLSIRFSKTKQEKEKLIELLKEKIGKQF